MDNHIQMNTASFGQPSADAKGLVIEITTETICFSEFDFEQKKPLFVCHYPLIDSIQNDIPQNVIEAIKHFNFGKKNYGAVYINFFTEKFTLCPIHFYDHQSARTLLEFNVGSTNNDLILVDDINSEIKLIYAIDEALMSLLNNVFPNHHLKHTQTVLSKIFLQAEEFQKDDVLLNLHQHYIEIIHKKNGKLVLANQFSVTTEEDVLYYVLFVLEQYQLNPLLVSIVLVGNTDSNSSIIKTLNKYIKYIRLATGHKSIQWQALYGMPQHFNYTLLNRLFCEL